MARQPVSDEDRLDLFVCTNTQREENERSERERVFSSSQLPSLSFFSAYRSTEPETDSRRKLREGKKPRPSHPSETHPTVIHPFIHPEERSASVWASEWGCMWTHTRTHTHSGAVRGKRLLVVQEPRRSRLYSALDFVQLCVCADLYSAVLIHRLRFLFPSYYVSIAIFFLPFSLFFFSSSFSLAVYPFFSSSRSRAHKEEAAE